MNPRLVTIDGPLSAATLKALKQFWRQICGQQPSDATMSVQVTDSMNRTLTAIEQAHREASARIEQSMANATAEQIKTLNALIEETRAIVDEVRRLRRP